jgi:FkbM family methyltransferase
MSSTSNSQYGQDQWVLEALGRLKGGFFLEIGAGDGLWISNTLILERDYQWTGILVEPTKVFNKLVTNRPAATCVQACLAAEEKDVTLFEVSDLGQAQIDTRAKDNTLLSSVRDDLDPSEGSEINRTWGAFNEARTVRATTLGKLLDDYNAPPIIDYFSLDVEGYEYEILRNFPFDRYAFRCLGVERPPSELQDLLARSGYVRRAELGDDVMFINPGALGVGFKIRRKVGAILNPLRLR